MELFCEDVELYFLCKNAKAWIVTSSSFLSPSLQSLQNPWKNRWHKSNTSKIVNKVGVNDRYDEKWKVTRALESIGSHVHWSENAIMDAMFWRLFDGSHCSQYVNSFKWDSDRCVPWVKFRLMCCIAHFNKQNNQRAHLWNNFESRIQMSSSKFLWYEFPFFFNLSRLIIKAAYCCLYNKYAASFHLQLESCAFLRQ